MKQRIIDLLAMSRFANLPTVWSNVLLAGVLAGTQTILYTDPGFVFKWGTIVIMAIAMSCLYLGGCFLNDWHDSEFDREHRPERPIPSQRWQKSTILKLSISLMAAGTLITYANSQFGGLFSLLIILSIIFYTKWHKTHPASFIFMAGSRFLIYPCTFFAITPAANFLKLSSSPSLILIAAVTMGFYILGISLSAAGESRRKTGTPSGVIIGCFFLLLPALFHLISHLLKHGSLTALIPILAFSILLMSSISTLVKNHEIGRFVSQALAMIPLVDWLILGPLALQIITFSSTSPPSFTEGLLLAISSPLLVLMARGLQRIAPAT